MPEPGEIQKFRNTQGNLIDYKWIVCQDCHEGRWVEKHRATQVFFTGRCKKCQVAKAKKESWASGGWR